MKKPIYVLILVGLFPIFLGTTYVVKEGDIEVGKLIVHDGQDRVETFQGDKPVSSPAGEVLEKELTQEEDQDLRKK